MKVCVVFSASFSMCPCVNVYFVTADISRVISGRVLLPLYITSYISTPPFWLKILLKSEEASDLENPANGFWVCFTSQCSRSSPVWLTETDSSMSLLLSMAWLTCRMIQSNRALYRDLAMESRAAEAYEHGMTSRIQWDPFKVKSISKSNAVKQCHNSNASCLTVNKNKQKQKK